MSGRDADDKAAGISYMILGVACLSWMDALGKRVAASYSVFQMLAIRSTVAIGLLIVLLFFLGKLRTLRTRQPGGHALRSMCALIAFVCFYAALRHLSLADAVAIAFGSPFLASASASTRPTPRSTRCASLTPRVRWSSMRCGRASPSDGGRRTSCAARHGGGSPARAPRRETALSGCDTAC